MADSLSDVDPTVDEVMTVLASQDDFQDLKQIANERQKIATTNHETCDEIKQIVNKLLGVNADAVREFEVQKCQMESLEENLKSAKQEKCNKIEELKQENDCLLSVQETTKEMRRAAGEVMKEDNCPDLATKYLSSLYSNITRVRWDYSASENDIQGYVTSLNDVKPFSLNSQTNSAFFVANYLWDLIDA